MQLLGDTCIVHCTVDRVTCTVYSAEYIFNIVYSTAYSVLGKLVLYTALCTVTTVECTIYGIQCKVYCLVLTVYSIYLSVYIEQCIVYSVQYALHSAQCTV